MRVQCTICTELYDNSAAISAIPCGHVFHEACLQRWLSQSMTCPQCRKKVTQRNLIHHLYLNIADDEDTDGIDPSKVQNDLDTAKAEISKMKLEHQEMLDAKDKVVLQLQDLKESLKVMEQTCKQERSRSSLLQKQLKMQMEQVQEADAARREAAALRKKFEEMKAVEQILRGCESDIQSMVANEGDSKQLATWCTILQKELQAKRQEVRTLRDTADKLKRELTSKRRDLQEKSDELSVTKEQLRTSEEDLKTAELKVSSLHKKIETLQKALGSPRDSATSFAHRLINESPAPLPTPKRPRLSEPSTSTLTANLDITPDLIDTPEPAKPSPNTKTKTDCKEYGAQFVKITSAAGASASQKPKRDMQDISNMQSISSFNLFKKPSFGTSQNSAIRNGYNGLGGHEKFLQPTGRPKLAVKKNASRVFAKNTVLKTSSSKVPPLPSMDIYLNDK